MSTPLGRIRTAFDDQRLRGKLLDDFDELRNDEDPNGWTPVRDALAEKIDELNRTLLEIEQAKDVYDAAIGACDDAYGAVEDWTMAEGADKADARESALEAIDQLLAEAGAIDETPVSMWLDEPDDDELPASENVATFTHHKDGLVTTLDVEDGEWVVRGNDRQVFLALPYADNDNRKAAMRAALEYAAWAIDPTGLV
jgi:hypothetical protein